MNGHREVELADVLAEAVRLKESWQTRKEFV